MFESVTVFQSELRQGSFRIKLKLTVSLKLFVPSFKLVVN